MLEIARSENQKLEENYVEPRDVRQSQQTLIFDFSHDQGIALTWLWIMYLCNKYYENIAST